MSKKPKIKRDKDGKREIEEIANRKGRLEITHRRVTPEITLDDLLAKIVALEAEVVALKK